MGSSKELLVIATILVAVSANSIQIPVKADTTAPVAFDFVGTVEGKIFIIANQLGYVNYYTAVQTCFNAGYSLAHITSQAQEDVVANYFKTNNHSGFAWLEGSDFVTRGEWYSQRSGQKLEFFNWVSGRPVSGAEGEDRRCIMWKRDGLNKGWWDISCNGAFSSTYLAFCQLAVAQ